MPKDQRDNDPDETEGRRLARAEAEGIVRMQDAIASRRVKRLPEPPVVD